MLETSVGNFLGIGYFQIILPGKASIFPIICNINVKRECGEQEKKGRRRVTENQ